MRHTPESAMIRHRTRRGASPSRMTQPPSVRCPPELSITPRPSNHASGWAEPRQKDRKREKMGEKNEERKRERKKKKERKKERKKEILLSLTVNTEEHEQRSSSRGSPAPSILYEYGFARSFSLGRCSEGLALKVKALIRRRGNTADLCGLR
ncbi:GTPase activating protein homolog 4-like [Onychostoma macrolepis]|uniref:GTPase activating protein homolog 4-like n=1 Tax=Onychostoma macrolepis TaxID=369639 RepID=UPI00272B1024|nr:GTPase activating protein homolog 4-like [Onychostoma macrolepis]